jgi:hypothetical protein
MRTRQYPENNMGLVSVKKMFTTLFRFILVSALPVCFSVASAQEWQVGMSAQGTLITATGWSLLSGRIG